ncbi:Uncharacterised protein [Weeksella virosa]|uniref:Uncharacterized protein n=1 Tax=Weeksella virosa (strain ATCC 43766 / DSM 16922 / JCM 21250 / CCUG 30538 / CDC 9751 / IAM 14551 / NBRC 16016 / NCTC 11634 / CL345/78) TaxID=865938 RepID=F0NXU2_WEEVC|nr:hypothetical protein [Weeksella virosa]ADX66999.1 hypothetical protein Weevi_0277 [Weeksella virosa DSM 16922]VEH63271.1 Uncharacterised protein [Weeksella virosa]
MAKKNQNTEIEKAQGQEVTFFIPNTESLGKLNELKPSFSLTLKYKTADEWAALKDQPVRAYFMGMKEIPNEDGEMINCALLVSQSECFLSGQMTLIEAVKNLQPQTPIEITYRNKRNNKSSQGSTMIFDVIKLA